MSKLDELKTRPPTHILTTRLDGRYLATAAVFWKNKNSTPRSLSELVRLTFESFVDIMCTNDLAEFIDNHADAIETLDRLGLTTQRLNKRTIRDVLVGEGLSLSSLDTSIDPMTPQHLRKASGQSTLSLDNPTLKEAQALMEKELLNPSDQVERAKQVTEDFKKHLGMFPANGDKEVDND